MTEVATRKRRKQNKSAAIRDYLKDHPEAGPTEVMNALLEQKIKVSATHVSNVKSRLASGHSVGVRGVGRPRKGTGPSDIAAGNVSIEMLIEAKKMVNRFGSIENAQRALATLSRLA